jgi:hypothetical protein
MNGAGPVGARPQRPGCKATAQACGRPIRCTSARVDPDKTQLRDCARESHHEHDIGRPVQRPHPGRTGAAAAAGGGHRAAGDATQLHRSGCGATARRAGGDPAFLLGAVRHCSERRNAAPRQRGLDGGRRGRSPRRRSHRFARAMRRARCRHPSAGRARRRDAHFGRRRPDPQQPRAAGLRRARAPRARPRSARCASSARRARRRPRAVRGAPAPSRGRR